MEEPTHLNESRFWDQITDWLLEPFGLPAAPVSDTKAGQRDGKDGQER